MATQAKWSDFASRDYARTMTAANQLLPFWAGLVLVVAIAWQLAKIAWLLVPGTAAGDPATAPAVQMPATSANGGANVQAIAAASIFGKAEQDAEPAMAPEIIDENLEETKLTNLSLKGTISSPVPELSAAIIADGGNKEQVYLIGDPISSRASLHAVYVDQVVLNEDGRLTALKLPEEFSAVSRTVTRRTQTRRATSNNTQSIQSVVSKNVARLADVIRPTPYFVNGEQQGYRVYPGRNRQHFASLGLRPGDLIKDIDGQALTDPTQAMQIFQSLGTANEVSVTVERDGEAQVLVLKTSQLDLTGEQNQ